VIAVLIALAWLAAACGLAAFIARAIRIADLEQASHDTEPAERIDVRA
jgi:hypothetical protein